LQKRNKAEEWDGGDTDQQRVVHAVREPRSRPEVEARYRHVRVVFACVEVFLGLPSLAAEFLAAALRRVFGRVVGGGRGHGC
jgi:hypothetical protein